MVMEREAPKRAQAKAEAEAEAKAEAEAEAKVRGLGWRRRRSRRRLRRSGAACRRTSTTSCRCACYVPLPAAVRSAMLLQAGRESGGERGGERRATLVPPRLGARESRFLPGFGAIEEEPMSSRSRALTLAEAAREACAAAEAKPVPTAENGTHEAQLNQVLLKLEMVDAAPKLKGREWAALIAMPRVELLDLLQQSGLEGRSAEARRRGESGARTLGGGPHGVAECGDRARHLKGGGRDAPRGGGGGGGEGEGRQSERPEGGGVEARKGGGGRGGGGRGGEAAARLERRARRRVHRAGDDVLWRREPPGAGESR